MRDYPKTSPFSIPYPSKTTSNPLITYVSPFPCPMTTCGVKLAPFNPTADDAIEAALSLSVLCKEDTILDLGCGDGKFLLMAALSQPGLTCVGYEYDPAVYARGMERLAQAKATGSEAEANASSRVTLHLGDATQASVEGFTCVFVYLVPAGLEVVKPQLEAVLSIPGGRVVSNMFRIPGLQADLRETRVVRGCSVYLYSRGV